MAERKSIPFGGGVSQLLEKMNGISHGAKQVFLWELVREAVEALYQIRLESLYDDNVIDDPRGLFIDIILDKSNHTLAITDNGIGMTEDYLKEFFNLAENSVEKYKDIIEELGREEINVDDFYVRDSDVNLGFFATFMVADKVHITTKHYGGDSQCTLFSSPRDNLFFVESCTISGPRSLHGTTVTLHLNKDQFEYLDEGRLKVLIDKFTFDLCPYPISIRVHHPCLNDMNIIQRLADVEENMVDMRLMRRRFAGLRKLFQEVLCRLVDSVIVSKRIFDLPSYLSLDGRRLEINPRSPLMEKLRLDAKRNPKDKKVVGMIRLQYSSGKYCIYLHERSSLPWCE